MLPFETMVLAGDNHMLRLFQAIQIERLITYLINGDKDVLEVCSGMEVEKEDLVEIMIEHFRGLGIFIVKPQKHAEIVKKHLLDALVHSPVIRQRRLAIQQQIEKSRAKSRRN